MLGWIIVGAAVFLGLAVGVPAIVAVCRVFPPLDRKDPRALELQIAVKEEQCKLLSESGDRLHERAVELTKHAEGIVRTQPDVVYHPFEHKAWGYYQRANKLASEITELRLQLIESKQEAEQEARLLPPPGDGDGEGGSVA